MSEVDELIAQIPMDQLAAQLGVDTQTAEQATRSVLPALLSGMQANAEHPDGARSLAAALDQHDGSLVDSFDLGGIDTEDGGKIVRHVFGPHQDQVVNQLGGIGGIGKDLAGKLLPLLAPIVMSWLAKRFQGGGQHGGLGGMLSDLLGNLTKGGGGGGFGDLLGGLLGGGRR
jgi:hypothetical protein